MESLTILEIGANDGQDSIRLAKGFPTAVIHCFEPDPRALEVLLTTRHERIKVHSVAISAQDGVVEFFQSSGAPPGRREEFPDGWHLSGSVRKPKFHLEVHPWCKFETSIEVESKTLDTWSAENGVQTVDLIWADVQGAEIDLIDGGRRVLASTRFLYTEFSDHELYEGQLSLVQMLDRLPGWKIERLFKHDVLLRNCALEDESRYTSVPLRTRFTNSTVRALKSTLARLGLSLTRSRVEPVPEPSFYVPPANCQIPHLGALYELVFGECSNGFFVEVGAFDGISHSNSSCLADVGWGGLLVEPVPDYAMRCRNRHAGNASVSVIECAVGDHEGTIELLLAGELTTSNRELAADYGNASWARHLMGGAEVIRAPQRTLDNILEESVVAPGFEVLIVDVEGAEQAVFGGFSLDLWQPTMMIVELSDSHPDLTSMRLSHALLARSIVAHGYDVVFKDQINTVFVRRESWPTTTPFVVPADSTASPADH